MVQTPFIHVPSLRKIVQQHWAENANLEQLCRRETIPAGQMISHARQPLADAYRIERGMVQVSDHQDVDIARRGIVLGAGDWYGLYALAPHPPRGADERLLSAQFPSGLRTLTETVVHRLPVDQYPAAIRQVDEAIKEHRERDLLGTPLGDEVFRMAVEAEIRLNQFLPRLLDALRRHADLCAIPTYQLVELAQEGELVEIEAEDATGWADIGASHWFFVAQGSVVLTGALDKKSGARLSEGSVVEGIGQGMWIRPATPRSRPRLVAIPRERIAHFARGVLHLRPEVSTILVASGERKRGILVTTVGKTAVSASAIAARLADTLQVELPKSRAAANDVRLVVLNEGPDRANRSSWRGLQVSTIDVREGDVRAKLEGALDSAAYADCPVVFDTTSLPNGKISQYLADRVGKVVMVSDDSFAPLPSDLGFSTATLVRAVLVGSASTGSYLAYHPRTVRLAFDHTDHLGHRPLDDLTDRDQAAFGRLARAVAERRIGLALGGGGAWGFAHVALIQELLRVHLPIDLVSGVSFGSLVGAFFAVGGAEALGSLMENRNWLQLSLGVSSALPRVVSLYLERVWRQHRERSTKRNGASNGRASNDGELLERLEVPFFPVSLNLETGEEWSPSLGKLGRGVQAASALAGMFSPVIDRGIRAVDGVFVNNVPEAVLTREGADFIIASDVTQTPPPEPEKYPSLLARLKDATWPFERMKDNMRAVGFLVKVANERDQVYANATFRPRLGGYSMWHFGRGEDMVRMVRDEANQFARDVKKQWDTLDWRPS
jgi:predicted acylesterase/phospholipase RssA